MLDTLGVSGSSPVPPRYKSLYNKEIEKHLVFRGAFLLTGAVQCDGIERITVWRSTSVKMTGRFVGYEGIVDIAGC